MSLIDQRIPRAHHHFPFDFSAVCYLKVDGGASPLVFEGSYEFQPKVGTLIIFSGLLKHQVPTTHAERMVVVMNFERAKLDREPAPQSGTAMRMDTGSV